MYVRYFEECLKFTALDRWLIESERTVSYLLGYTEREAH